MSEIIKFEPKNPEEPVYEFPVAFTWGPSVMKWFPTEEARHKLAMTAFRELANRQTDTLLRLQFFYFEEVRYVLAAHGSHRDDAIPHIWVDVNGDFEGSLFKDLYDGEFIKKRN